MQMVDVSVVLEHFDDLQIDDPPSQNRSHLVNQCKGYCIMWPKKAINLLSISNFVISSTQCFESDDCNGACGNMSIDLEQPVGEMLPHHPPPSGHVLGQVVVDRAWLLR
jgi:hypothetical protein